MTTDPSNFSSGGNVEQNVSLTMTVFKIELFLTSSGQSVICGRELEVGILWEVGAWGGRKQHPKILTRFGITLSLKFLSNIINSKSPKYNLPNTLNQLLKSLGISSVYWGY